jgi:hypothetical protein
VEKTWREWIVEAMQDLGGRATYDRLYQRLQLIRPGPFTDEWQATVRRTIETHSSDSENFDENGPDLFYSVDGIGSGCWGLRADVDLRSIGRRNAKHVELASAIARIKNVPIEKALVAVERASEEERKGWRNNLEVKAAIAAIRFEKLSAVLADSKS